MDLVVSGFVALWRGSSPRPADLGADPSTVEALLRGGRLVLSPDGRITGIHGLSLTATAHRVAHDGGVIHTWCAYDAVGIPAALGIDAEAHTTCPTCGRHLEVTFTAGRPDADPDLRLWMPTTPCHNVLADLCAHANLYCTAQHLSAHIPDPTTGTPLTIPQATTLALPTWHPAATALASPDASTPES